MKPTFFASEADFRRWLQANHETARELLVGFWKKGSGKPSIDWPQARDQALCFGWIDGIRKSLGEDAYTIRFTPRRKGSYWSAVNIRKAQSLIERGLMHAAGLAAFEARDGGAPRRYSNENPNVALDEAMIRRFKATPNAWAWFQEQSTSFRKAAAHWVTSAKKPETRDARLGMLIDAAARGGDALLL